jgi:hypothetical protein
VSASPKLRTAFGRGWLPGATGTCREGRATALSYDGWAIRHNRQSANLRLEFRHEHEINGLVRANIPLERHVDIVRQKDREGGQLQKLLDDLISHDMAMISLLNYSGRRHTGG